MRIQTQIEFKEYLNLMYRLTYKNPFTILMSITGGVLLTNALLGIITSFLLGKAGISKDFFISMIVGIGLVVSMPWIIYQQAKRNYFTDGRIGELTTYEFSPETVHIQGESFTSTLTWNKIWKVVELKDWILLYQNQLIANLIPKKNLEEEQLQSLRNIINAHPTLKKNLKNNQA